MILRAGYKPTSVQESCIVGLLSACRATLRMGETTWIFGLPFTVISPGDFPGIIGSHITCFRCPCPSCVVDIITILVLQWAWLQFVEIPGQPLGHSGCGKLSSERTRVGGTKSLHFSQELAGLHKGAGLCKAMNIYPTI